METEDEIVNYRVAEHERQYKAEAMYEDLPRYRGSPALYRGFLQKMRDAFDGLLKATTDEERLSLYRQVKDALHYGYGFPNLASYSKLASSTTGYPYTFADDAPDRAVSTDGYIGLTRKAAADKARAAGLKSRVTRVDEKWVILTLGYRPDRLNFEVDDGLVTAVRVG